MARGQMRWALLAVALCGARTEDSAPAVRVFFQLDPGPSYGGPRWVPAPFSVTTSRPDAGIEARAEGVAPDGGAVGIEPRWRASDATHVVVRPEHGARVAVFVLRAGRSRLQVGSTELEVVSRQLAGEAATVNFSQPK